MHASNGFVGDTGGEVVLSEQVPDHVVVGTEATQQHVTGGKLHDLRRRQRGDQVSRFIRDAQSGHRLGLVLANQVLRQHEVGAVSVPDPCEHLLACHRVPFADRSFLV